MSPSPSSAGRGSELCTLLSVERDTGRLCCTTALSPCAGPPVGPQAAENRRGRGDTAQPQDITLFSALIRLLSPIDEPKCIADGVCRHALQQGTINHCSLKAVSR